MTAAATIVVMALGLVGTVVPLIPGLPLIWVAGLGYGAIEGFDTVGIVAIALMAALMVGGIAIKYALAQASARRSGAPASTIVFAAVLGFIGFFVIPVVGFFVGAPAGVLLAERRRLGDWGPAWTSTKSVIVAFGIGALLEITAGVLMIAVWIAWWLLI
jgi:uncharacterized protein YqgC (DUF456 family)